MRSFRDRHSARKKVFLSLSGSIGSQLRDEFAKKNEKGLITQTSIAEKLGVNKSVVNRRLTGQVNMTEETLADMVWALGCCIKVEIFDPVDRPGLNHPLAPEIEIYSSTTPDNNIENTSIRNTITASRTAQIRMSKLQMAQ